jgi:16S rRNA (uracil1498-N3)-methyltransferase
MEHPAGDLLLASSALNACRAAFGRGPNLLQLLPPAGNAAKLVYMARRRFFVDTVEHGHAQILGEQAHHLTHVLRAGPGERFEISDNRRVYLAEVESVRMDQISFTIVEPIEISAPVVHTRLLASLTKFERFEWMIEKATEVGVDEIVPVVAERSEKGLDQAARKRLARWKRIVREASEQARRAHLPELGLPISLGEALQTVASYRYVLEESGARPILAELPLDRKPADRVTLLVGPEGGWTDREREAFLAADWTAVWLGSNILRAETAAVAGLAIIQAAWAAGAG